MVNDFIEHLRTKSREIAPDYPNIHTDLDPHEHLWAITASYEGVSMANDDLHACLEHLRGILGWDILRMVNELEGIKRKDEVWREHACYRCKLAWRSPVTFSDATQNLSGEPTTWCPQCHKRANESGSPNECLDTGYEVADPEPC